MAIRLGFGRGRNADIAGGAGPVLYDERALERDAELLGEQASDDVRATASGKRHDNRDGSRWPLAGLRGHQPKDRHQSYAKRRIEGARHAVSSALALSMLRYHSSRSLISGPTVFETCVPKFRRVKNYGCGD